MKIRDFFMQYISKHHEFILCEHEKAGAVKLSGFLKKCKSIYSFALPYGIRKGYRTEGILRPGPDAYHVIRALVDFVFLVHEDGFTFDGNLSIDNMYWLPNCKKVKVWGLMADEMLGKFDDGMVSDFRFLNNLISKSLFRTGNVPRELRHLLNLMKIDPLRYSNLIRYNIALLDDEDKVGKYMILHQKLVLAKMVDQKMYAKALSYISCGRCEGLNNWHNDILYHPALVKLFNKNRGSWIKADVEGATVFGHHACHHLAQYTIETTEDSANEVSAKTSVNSKIADDQVFKKCNMANEEDTIDQKEPGTESRITFSVGDIFPLLECFLPGLFSQVQEAVFEIIEKQYPHELQKLRNKRTGGA